VAGAQVVAVTSSSPIKSRRPQPLLDSDVEKLVGVVCSSRTSSGCGDICLQDGCGFCARLTTSRPQLTMSSRL
jgi:hypothetical protein